MKLRSFIPAIVIFLLGVILKFAGALFKILHWELGRLSESYLLTLATIMQVIGVIMIIFVLLRFYFRKQK